MDLGITSVIWPGSHFNAQNADENRRYIWDESYTVDGKQHVHKAGQAIEHGKGKALLDFRDENPETWKEMQEFGFRFYQQPAGFEDSVISCWKISEQGKIYPCSIGLRDMFTGGLSESARLEMAICQQLGAWIRGKVTACIQLADTHVIRQIKLIKLALDHKLRTELHKLAELENTRAVFTCCMYAVMRMLRDVMKETRKKLLAENTLLRGAYQNGWYHVRPNMEKQCFEKTCDQAWAKDLKLGSHRLRDSWFDQRSNVDETGMPKLPVILLEDNDEQSYSVEEGDKRTLKVWEENLQTGKMTEQEFKDLQEEPWFEDVVEDFKGIEGLGEFKQLMLTPAQQRLARGIDPKLKSQKQNDQKKAGKRKAKNLERQSRRPLRKEAVAQIKQLRQEGYSREQISAAVINPAVGKGASGKTAQKKKQARDKFAQKLWHGVKKTKEEKAKSKGAADGESSLPEVQQPSPSVPSPSPYRPL